jgi:hypothetical protein
MSGRPRSMGGAPVSRRRRGTRSSSKKQQADNGRDQSHASKLAMGLAFGQVPGSFETIRSRKDRSSERVQVDRALQWVRLFQVSRAQARSDTS